MTPASFLINGHHQAWTLAPPLVGGASGRSWPWRAYLLGAVLSQALQGSPHLLFLFQQVLTEALDVADGLPFPLELVLQRFDLQSQRPSPRKSQFHQTNL